MTASSRFGYSMFAGAIISGALVGWESAKRPAKIAANATAHHMSEGVLRLSGFIAFAVAIGLVLFVVATAVRARSRPQRRGAQAAPARPRGYGGYR